MMEKNEFHGNAAFSGGGFMPSQSTETIPDRPSSSSKQLKDLSRGGEYGISIDGVDVNNIVLVGMVSKIDNPVSDCTFRVDDSTGWVECFSMLLNVYIYIYVCCVGFMNKYSTHTHISPLHFECIYVHLYNTNLRELFVLSQLCMYGGMTTQPEVANSNFGNPTKGYGYQTNLTNQFSGQYNTVEEQICGVSSRVLQYLRQPACLTSETGVPSVVARELNVSYDKIRSMVQLVARPDRLGRHLLKPNRPGPFGQSGNDSGCQEEVVPTMASPSTTTATMATRQPLNCQRRRFLAVE
ncbi:hypothetical protein PVK06_025282 [Gossypium arboreum]|uniref:Replication protein A C-terminal domain-containing protein n=1 Tax=Gossypium arboreum TaxID=29729 RepID=A0ABR0PG26_GOSAR|nr:hypothetical protein PVK06_025282 [Gossypium arboreum]